MFLLFSRKKILLFLSDELNLLIESIALIKGCATDVFQSIPNNNPEVIPRAKSLGISEQKRQ
jgi:hypothetical protein